MITFLPMIALLFLFLSLLEDSGYMARAAFVMDRTLRHFGLSGKAFIPMLMGVRLHGARRHGSPDHGE